MESTDIRREALPKVAEPASLLTSLALKAEAVLGYSWLRSRLGVEIGTLRQALQEVGIEPFSKQDVETYKEERERKAEKQAWDELAERARQDGFPGLFGTGSYARAQWRSVPLRRYDGEVPAFALSHALEIKERVPNAEFEVEELRVEKRYDPFLLVSLGRERFYIDVWDEAEFETRNI